MKFEGDQKFRPPFHCARRRVHASNRRAAAALSESERWQDSKGQRPLGSVRQRRNEGLIPREYITELVQRSDIADVVQSYVQLRARGRTYTGLCPFHNEKTPSFVVYPESQSF